LKRNNEPYKGQWDLPGGYVNGSGETPSAALKREIQEEFGIIPGALTYMKKIPGQAPWKEKSYAVLNHFYLVNLDGQITLNEENSEFEYVDLKTIRPDDIAFDSNQKMVAWLKEYFVFDLARVTELTHQLDDSAIIDEQALYKAMLDVFVSKIYDGEKLVGMGWIFPRQTMLRRQAVVEDMIVDNAYRGKGYGKKILLDLLDWAKKEGMEMVELTTNPKRVAANELYKSVGFVLHPTNHYLYKI